MNKIDRKLTVFLSLTLLFLLPSCVKENVFLDEAGDKTAQVSNLQGDIKWANAIVTVRKSYSGRSYFQLEERVTLDPVGWENPYSGEVRALVAYSGLGQKSDFCTKAVAVERIDSIITKEANYIDIEDGMKSPPADEQVFLVDVGYKTTSDLLAGSDPVEIVSSMGTPDWLTFSEDGYLTIHFATYWGGVATHSVSLYASKAHPDHLYFVHRNNYDLQTNWGEGLIAFKMFHMYIGRKDEFRTPREITLHWMSFDGEKEAVFKYGRRVENK